MFYLIGLGLGDASDITVKGLEVVRRAKRVYLEAYTSILTVGKEALESFYGREVILADRDMVEQSSDDLMADAEENDVAFLVVGDPLGATTHTDLILRAVEKGLEYCVIHNASIMNAIGCCGLQLYNYGETISIVFWEKDWKPESFYDKILVNRERGMHTLCLLDIKMKEQTIENLMKGRPIYEPPRFLSASQACQQLLDIVNRRDDDKKTHSDLTPTTVCVAVARVGASDQKIAVATLEEMCTVDMGNPLHSLVIPGHMHPLEVQMLKLFAVSDHVRNILEATEER
ncbi:diphthine methyl ester synthase-like [Plakobranchus ocellatus]|uniref:diphthine methyl ester synthase n=1 Tax=Plakobranchus ocellatus TaxID=259542 RepID=A0AAV4ARQ5_9GAST|nr:diphthine methyl ester synthase-like [Plakobranchus ocellatus]